MPSKRPATYLEQYPYSKKGRQEGRYVIPRYSNVSMPSRLPRFYSVDPYVYKDRHWGDIREPEFNLRKPRVNRVHPKNEMPGRVAADSFVLSRPFLSGPVRDNIASYLGGTTFVRGAEEFLTPDELLRKAVMGPAHPGRWLGH